MNKVKGILILCLIILLAGCLGGNRTQVSPDSYDDLAESHMQMEKKTKNFGPISQTTGHILGVEGKPENFFGVMIENSPPARPQTGLVYADVVYEILVEYQMTRFFALFQDDIPEKAGPIRSSRHYYLPITESWNAPYYHLGGSKFAYEQLPHLQVPSFDSTGQGYKYMERDPSRKTPHNAYLMIDRIPKLENEAQNPHFDFKNSIDYEGEEVEAIEIIFDRYTVTSYKYDEEEKLYSRYLQGDPHVDRDSGEWIKAKNIFLLYAPHKDMHTEQRHIDIDFKSGGSLEYFVEGVKIEGTWTYDDGDMVFYDGGGEKLKVLPGKTWIQVVDTEGIRATVTLD